MPWGTHWRKWRSGWLGFDWFAGARVRAVMVWAYNAYGPLSAAPGASGTNGSSTRQIDDPIRAAFTAATMAVDGLAGISDTALWAKLLPFGPVGGVRNFDPLIFDLALAEADLYPGSRRMFRANGGNNDTPNFLGGGGAGLLAQQPATGQKIFFMAADATGRTLPTVGSSALLSGVPDAREGSVVTNVVPGTGQITLTANIAGNHLAGTVVEWTKTPAAFQALFNYLPGDLIIAPPGGLNTAGVPADNLVYCATKAYTSGATFWPIEPTLCEIAIFSDGTSMPVPWDPNFLSERIALINWMAQRYDGDPRLGQVACSGAGRVGEVGIDGDANASQRVSTWLVHGYNDQLLIEAWKTIILAYRSAFKVTPLIFSTGEPWGQGMTWPGAVPLANCTVSNASPSVSMTSSAGAVAGQLVSGHSSVQNFYVGSVPDGTHITLSSSQSANVPVNGNANAAGIALVLNSTSRAVAFTLSTNDESTTVVTVTDGSLTRVDRGKLLTGSGFSGRRYVGPTGDTAQGAALGLAANQFLVSTSRIGYVQPGSHAIAATTLTLALDGLNYSTQDAVGGILTQALAGKNPGGALTNDMYAGGTPVPGFLAGLNIAVQQNGQAATDLNALPLGRFRQVIGVLWALAAGLPNQVLQLAYGGYQAVGGGNIASDIKIMLQVASDDKVKSYELYRNDCITAAGPVITDFSNGIRPT